MRKIMTIIIVTALMIFLGYLQAPFLYSQDTEVEFLMNNYFQFLKAGDTESILSVLTDPLLSERENILKNNPAYPNFLRAQYKTARFVIEKAVDIQSDKKSIDVEIYFDEKGQPLKPRFLLKKEKGFWKISDELTNF